MGPNKHPCGGDVMKPLLGHGSSRPPPCPAIAAPEPAPCCPRLGSGLAPLIKAAML